MKEYHYKIFNLNVSSCINCPELMPGNGAKPDIRIRIGDVPQKLDNVKSEGVRYQIAKKQFLLRLENVARYYVHNGTDIVVEPAHAADEDSIRVFLLGSAIGALLHQRGIIPLHGSAIQVGNEAVVFAGKSGAGKSTLAATFYKRDYRILCDDISAISIGSDGSPYVLPAYPRLKLWKDSLEQLGDVPGDLERTREKLEKYNYMIHDRFDDSCLPLKKVYELISTNKPEFDLKSVSGMDKIDLLVLNTYRFQFMNGLNVNNFHFNECSKIANKISISKVYRPNHNFLLNELVSLLEKDFH